MNNPNPNYINGQAADPDDDFDAERFIAHVFDELAAQGRNILRWFELRGFVDVKVRRLPQRGPNSWECLMLRGEDSECRTQAEVQALVVQLAEDLGCWVDQGEFCGLVWADRVGTHFRLRPLPV